MIYIVRHGQTDWNLKQKIQGQIDISLNQTGINEAETCAKKLEGIKIDQIISSDLKRAYRTAEIINGKFNLPIKKDKRLREMNFGDFQGKYIKDISSDMWNVFNYNPEKYNAESYKHLYERVKDFLSELDINKNILVITHGGPIRVAMYYTNNQKGFNYDDFEKRYRHIDMKNVAIFQLKFIEKEVMPIEKFNINHNKIKKL